MRTDFARVASTLAIEAQRDAGFVKMGVKASGLGEGPNIELIGIFQGDFGFVGDRFGHGWVSFVVRPALHRKIAEASFDLDQRKKRPVAAHTTKFWRRTRPAVCGHPARYRA
jgi:hypothetical protein